LVPRNPLPSNDELKKLGWVGLICPVFSNIDGCALTASILAADIIVTTGDIQAFLVGEFLFI